MGKPTGFLEYERTEARSVEPKERIKNYKELRQQPCIYVLFS